MMTTPIVPLQLLVGGRWRDGAGPEIVSSNPARPSEVVARGASASGSDVGAAIAAAAAARDEWRRKPHHERGAILRKAASVLEVNAAALGAELTREEGKTLTESTAEVHRAAQILDYYGSEADRECGELYASPRGGESILVTRHPLGVVAVITPFNYPLAIPAWKIAAALTYGNTVVWKAASVVPLLAQRLAQALVEAGLPDGVLNLLQGAGTIGQAMIEHDEVDAVTFTGSNAVGRALIARCGVTATPLQAEMGGKNAAVVLADADLDVALDAVVAGAFRAAGQRCTATSRSIVHADIADEFITRLVDRADQITIGEPLDPATEMGPVVTEAARASIAAAVTAAESDASRLTTRTLSPDIDQGHYLTPTVLELSDTCASLWQEEIFGPVLAVVRATSTDDAFRLANDGQFGLSCSVFTQDSGTTLRAIDEIEVGVLHINSESGGADPHVPFGGAKRSAFGPKEQGRAAREFFTSSRTIYLRSGR